MSVLVNDLSNICAMWIEFNKKYYRGSCDGAKELDIFSILLNVDFTVFGLRPFATK